MRLVSGYRVKEELRTYDVDVVALFIHRLHLSVTELRHSPPSLHEVLVELALQLELFARQQPAGWRGQDCRKLSCSVCVAHLKKTTR